MIEVIKSGMYDSIQDLGRFGVQHYGVPYSGSMDLYSAKLANLIVGNLENCAVLEMTIVAPKLRFHSNTEIVLCGAEMNPSINSEPVSLGVKYVVSAGDILSFGTLSSGCRCYLAVKGGFQSEFIFNSFSMYAPVTHKSRLKSGDTLDILPLNKTKSVQTNAHIRRNNSHFETDVIEVYKGIEFKLLSLDMREELFSKTFTISKDSNRMAYQFNEPLKNSLESILTAPVLPGTVQLTASGQLLCLMRDAQTTGGYPRILQISEHSLNVLSQKTFGNKIRLKCLD